MRKVRLGENIRILRKLSRETGKTLASILGVSKYAVSKWENEKCLPDLEIVLRIAGYYQVNLEDLIFSEILQIKHHDYDESTNKEIKIVRLNDNIRNMRKSFEETGEKLASVLGVTKYAVSKWDNKECLPELKNVLKIAEHYRINVEDLVYSEVPEIKYINLLNLDKPIAERWIRNTFPVMVPPENIAIEHLEHFMQGLIRQNQMMRLERLDINIFLLCFNEYMQCPKEIKNTAITNMMSLLIFYGQILFSSRYKGPVRKFKNGKITKKELINSCYLKDADCSDDLLYDANEETTNNQKEYFDEVNLIIPVRRSRQSGVA